MTPRAPGIYIIRQTTTNRVYVGSAINLRERELAHFRRLRAGTHVNAFMQRAFAKDPESFEFIVAVECSRDELLTVEQVYLDELYDRQRQCFNINPIAGSMLGYRHSKASRRKIAKARYEREWGAFTARRGVRC